LDDNEIIDLKFLKEDKSRLLKGIDIHSNLINILEQKILESNE